ncbi:putative Bgh-specific protein [Blumeria hordei DH14]|uniref:Putative Bgh-specific protein n=1 Tax=Blumeria graminis f. sp. hordei (strain DH14) TaxID=546991 RepID=N1JPD5_BLUG1|nr:putative Bgh-specific protein [Blumeria hordei DH14]
MIRRENHHEHCMKLSDRQDFDNFDTNLEEYEIHKCKNVVFGETYLKASVKAACEAGRKPHTHRYPLKYGETPLKRTIYKWPLHYNNKIHGMHRKKSYHLKYFVLYIHEDGPMHVIETSKKLSKDCSLKKKVIPPSAYDSNIIGAQESLNYDDKKIYDCRGQIFTDKYIQEVFLAVKSETSGSNDPSLRKDEYTLLENIGEENASDLVWIWYLRVREADFRSMFGPPFFLAFANLKGSSSIEKYVLAVDKNYQTFNVYYFENRKYIACNSGYKQVTSISEYSPDSPEFSVECPDCGKCRYHIKWKCENNLADQKRQKIQHLDSDNNWESGFDIPGWF